MSTPILVAVAIVAAAILFVAIARLRRPAALKAEPLLAAYSPAPPARGAWYQDAMAEAQVLTGQRITDLIVQGQVADSVRRLASDVAPRQTLRRPR